MHLYRLVALSLEGKSAPVSHAKIQAKNPSGVEIAAPMSAIGANSLVSESHSVTSPAGSVAGTYNVYVIVNNNSVMNQSQHEQRLRFDCVFTRDLQRC
jgi:hypothetical protein